MNVLIVEDEEMIARFLCRIAQDLEVVNVVETASTYEQGYELMMSGVFDLLLVDVCLGGDEWDGLTLCEMARKHFPGVTIIILTSLHSLECLERAFSLGVNDYMTKPFHPEELRLRMMRWLGTSPLLSSTSLRYGELVYEAASHEFRFRGRSVELSKRNKDLLLVFMKEPERLLSPAYLKEKFWGDLQDKSRNIRSSLQSLRESMPEDCADWIQTLRGQGYILRKQGK